MIPGQAPLIDRLLGIGYEPRGLAMGAPSDHEGPAFPSSVFTARVFPQRSSRGIGRLQNAAAYQDGMTERFRGVTLRISNNPLSWFFIPPVLT